MRQKVPPYRLYLLTAGALALLNSVAYALATLYYVQRAGASPLQLVLIGTAVEATYFLFEVPTGVVADTYGRRLSVVIGVAMVGVAIAFEGTAPLFLAIALAEAVRGLGETFISGALEAWLADEVGEGEAGRAYLRAAQVAQLCSLAGIPIAAVLAGGGRGLPMVVAGTLMACVAVALALIMPEQGFRPAPRGERSSWRAMGETLDSARALTRRRPWLLAILGIAVCFGAYSEGFDRLSEAHFLVDVGFPVVGKLSPVIWLAAIAMASSLVVLPLTELARRRVDTASHRSVTRALYAITATLGIAVVAFALLRGFPLALAAYLAAGALRGTQDPLYTAWLNQHVEPSVRATVISMGGQANALGQIGGGPAVGVIGSLRGMRVALAASGLLLLPALALYRLLLRASPASVAATEETGGGTG